MGWRLVVEVLDHCPDLKYRQFRVLVALALDARDETRQGMPGTELLTLRANCRMRQARQAVADLKARGIIKTVRRSAPGVRAVYEILPLGPVDNPGDGCGHARTRTGADPEQRVRIPGERVRMSTNPITSDNATTPQVTEPDSATATQSLELSHRTESSLSSAERAAQRLLNLGGTEREIRFIVDKIIKDPKIRYAGPYLAAAIDRGDGPVLLAEARQKMAEADVMRRAFGWNGGGAAPASPKSAACRTSDHEYCPLPAACPCDCHQGARNGERNRQLDALEERMRQHPEAAP